MGTMAVNFVNSLNASCRVAIEYRRKAVKIEKEGDLQVLQYSIKQADSGLEMKGPPVQNMLRSGGDPEAYLNFVG